MEAIQDAGLYFIHLRTLTPFLYANWSMCSEAASCTACLIENPVGEELGSMLRK